VGRDEDVVDPTAGPAFRQQIARQVRIAEGHGPVGRDELDLLA
jgi:hypothetical protein